MHCRDYRNQTPLHLAAQYRRAEIAKLLLYINAKVDVEDDHRQTPLHIAAVCGNTEVMQQLLCPHVAFEDSLLA